jgi:hypothetical protein
MADAFKKLDKKIVSSLGITKRTKPVAFDKWMNRLNINTEKYIYSKDILRVKNNDFAYYVYNNGFGFVSDSNEVVYDLDGKQLIHVKGDSNKLSIGKSYMQMIYSDFNDL